MRQILIIDDERNIRTQLSGLLADEGYRALAAVGAEQGLELLQEESPDLVILDVMLPGMSGLEALAKIRENGDDTPVIIMSGQASIEAAVKATHLGAFDYLEKPLDPERLLVTVRNAIESGALRRKNRELSREVSHKSNLVGRSAAMESLRDAVVRAAKAEARVLITGENGTGKELVARALHDKSARRREAFIRVNCAAIPKDLIESELFGHEKGAFTGAANRKIGKLEAADGGSLLLDEVGDMALDAQAKLLRVLEENEVERVGGTKTIPVNVRVIAATNKDLPEAIQSGIFREDLYYRLNVVPIAVPPLRARADDIPELVEHFRSSLALETARTIPVFEPDALAALQRWSWPGNVRELRNVVERLTIMTDAERIRAGDVAAVLQGARPGSPPGGAADASATASGGSLREVLEDTERRLIEQALDASAGVISEAARALGMDRANLHRKMRRLGIDRADAETEATEPSESDAG